jgi:hypothetical protein
MQRTRHNVFAKATTPRYVVVWSIHWQVIECQRLEPATDLCAAMAATIERLHVEGWEADGSAEHGFVFIRRSDERRLVMITERDPYGDERQSFTPFGP